MTPRFKDEHVAVYDDFLSAHEQQELLRYLDTARYRKVMPEALGSAFRISDGDPFVGTEAVMRKDGAGDLRPAYPTETALDIVIERLRDHRSAIDEIICARGAAWSNATVCPYLYPAGCGLSWHTDGAYVGAYIYYAHQKWSPHWGGELLVSAGEAGESSAPNRRLVKDDEAEPPPMAGMGYFFAPRPNRMIYLRGGTFHAIKKVEAAAGDNMRISVSGFFMA
jgi:hypothetical protein